MEPFDFARPPELPRGATDGLHEVLTAAAARAGMLTAAALRIKAEFAIGDIETVRVGELIGAGQAPYQVELADGIVGLIGIGAPLVVELADVIMGGPGLVAERGPTPLERDLVARRLTAGLVPVADALAVLGVNRFVVSPATDGLDREAEMLGIRIDVALGDVAGAITMALPMSVIPEDTTVDELAHHDEDRIDPAMAAALSDIPIDVTIQFDPIRIAAAALEELSPGDVIRLEHPHGRPVLGTVDGQAWFLAQPGRHGKTLAVQVQHVLDNMSGDEEVSP